MARSKKATQTLTEEISQETLDQLAQATDMAHGKTPETIDVPNGWTLLPAGVERFIRVARHQLQRPNAYGRVNGPNGYVMHTGKWAVVYEGRREKISGFEVKVLGTCTLAHSTEVAHGCGGSYDIPAAGMVTSAALLVQVSRN